MDEATARQRIEQLVQSDQDPALTMDEIDTLVECARVFDAAGNSPRNVATGAASWEANATVLVGSVVRTSAGRYARCTIPGTSGSTEPSWPVVTTGDHYSYCVRQVLDGTVTWEDAGTEWAPTFDLDAAAAVGWRMKAAKAAGRFDFGEDGQQFTRSQIVAHCRAMAEDFASGGATSLTV